MKICIGDAVKQMPHLKASLCTYRYEEVHVGEPAELLLLSNTPDFSSFKVSLLWPMQPCKDASTPNLLVAWSIWIVDACGLRKVKDKRKSQRVKL